MGTFFLFLIITTVPSFSFAMRNKYHVVTIEQHRAQLAAEPLPQCGDIFEYPDALTQQLPEKMMPTAGSDIYICNAGLCDRSSEIVDLLVCCRGCGRKLCQRCEIKRCYSDKRCTDPDKEYFLMVRYCASCMGGNSVNEMCDFCMRSGVQKARCCDCLGVKRTPKAVKLKWFFWGQKKQPSD